MRDWRFYLETSNIEKIYILLQALFSCYITSTYGAILSAVVWANCVPLGFFGSTWLMIKNRRSRSFHFIFLGGEYYGCFKNVKCS